MTERRRILLVEDNPGDALLIQQMIGASLDVEAWEVTWVQRLDQAARTLGDRPFDVALLDPLTGLYNRRGFDPGADQHLRVARRSGKGAFSIFCDVDGLKRINDTNGHSAGDEALCLVAGALRDALRRSDLLARLGGDEFAVLGIETGGAYEDVLAGRIQEALTERTRLGACSALNRNALETPVATSTPAVEPVENTTDRLLGLLPGGGPPDPQTEPDSAMRYGLLASLAFPVDVSLGLARVGAEANSNLSGLLDFADRAMYAARGAVRS